MPFVTVTPCSAASRRIMSPPSEPIHAVLAPKLEPKMTAESAARRASRYNMPRAPAAAMAAGCHMGTESIILKTMRVAGSVSKRLQKSIVTKPETKATERCEASGRKTAASAREMPETDIASASTRKPVTNEKSSHGICRSVSTAKPASLTKSTAREAPPMMSTTSVKSLSVEASPPRTDVAPSSSSSVAPLVSEAHGVLRSPPSASPSAPADPSAATSTLVRLVKYISKNEVRPAAMPGTPIRAAKERKVSPMSSASSTLVGLPVTSVTAQMLPAKNWEKRKGISGRLSSWHIRIVMGVRVIVTMSSGMRTVRHAEKQPSAQKSPHGERPYRCTTLVAAVCRKPERSSAVHRYTEPRNMTTRWYGRSEGVP
eukprot:scaffold72490_cov26-Tisochrysis_lutea.AAC.2